MSSTFLLRNTGADMEANGVSNPQPEQPKQNWWQRLPTWAKWVIGVIGAFVLMGIGGAIVTGSNEEDSLKEEIATLEKDVEVAEDQADEEEERADKVIGQAAQIKNRAEEEADRIVSDSKREANELLTTVNSTKGELESLEGELSDTEAELGGAEERVAKGTITDGTWKLEQDYLPGTYEAQGGGGCYWALLSSVGGGLEAIIENGGFNKHQILTIESPYFETRGCGTWHLVE